MQSHKLLVAGVAIALVALAGSRTNAQNTSPFTIRRPPDGATVREKVKVQIPLTSIPNGGYVAIYIDGQFRGAIPVTDAEREEITANAEKSNSQPFFTYVWDTKSPVRAKGNTVATVPPDGAHEISARLYTVGEGASQITVLKETSSVKVSVANKLESDSVGELKLAYKFVTGDSRDYKQSGANILVAGLSQGKGGIDDQELASYDSELAIGVEDRYPTGNAMIRNKMRRLEVREGANISVFPSEQLPSALYQEVNQFGHVEYQNNNHTSFDQFAQAGIPVAATLELPQLPTDPKKVNDTWNTPDVSLEIPGMADSDQPKVTVNSKLVAIEWEGGYPTAHIHQSYDSSKAGGFKPKQVTFGSTVVLNPSVKLEKDIFIAYRSGSLVKVSRTLTVSGKDANATSDTSAGGGAPGMSGGGAPAMGSNGSMAGMSGMGGKKGGGMAGMGSMGSPSGMGQGSMGGGRSGGPAGGKMGSPTGMGQGLMGSGSGRMGGGAPSGLGSGSFRGSFGGGSTSTGSQQITLKATTVTELKGTVK